MPDSGDAALVGMLVGAGAGHVVTDGNFAAIMVGAAAGLVVSGQSFESILEEPDFQGD